MINQRQFKIHWHWQVVMVKLTFGVICLRHKIDGVNANSDFNGHSSQQIIMKSVEQKKNTYYWNSQYLCIKIFVQEQKFCLKNIFQINEIAAINVQNHVNMKCAFSFNTPTYYITYFILWPYQIKCEYARAPYPLLHHRSVKLAHCFPEYGACIEFVECITIHLSFTHSNLLLVLGTFCIKLKNKTNFTMKLFKQKTNTVPNIAEKNSNSWGYEPRDRDGRIRFK